MSIHLKNLTSGMLGELTIIVGDPARAYLLSQSWENTQEIVNTREFVLITGSYLGHLVSICSTGIGVGSTEIAVLELIENGAKKIVRCGGCGAWQEGIAPGDIIMNSGMARSKGLLSDYVISEYPAVADPILYYDIYSSYQKAGLTVHKGIGLTAETYYLGQARTPNILSKLKQPHLFDYWTPRHILNCEMETAVLYLLGSLYNIPVANSLVVHVSRHNEKWTDDSEYDKRHKQAGEIVIKACLGIN